MGVDQNLLHETNAEDQCASIQKIDQKNVALNIMGQEIDQEEYLFFRESVSHRGTIKNIPADENFNSYLRKRKILS